MLASPVFLVVLSLFSLRSFEAFVQAGSGLHTQKVTPANERVGKQLLDHS
jgi:hypothetical protein